MAGDIGKTFGRVAISAAGFGLGSMIGYPALGSALSLGIGSFLFPPKQETKIRHVRSALGTSSVEGTPVPVVFGRVRIGATLMYAGSFVYHEIVKKQSGKGGGSSTVVADAWYTLSFAMAIGEGPISLVKIYEGKNVVNPSYTWYDGSDGQLADSFLTGQTGKQIAYKNTSYIVFQDYRVGPTQQVPQLTFEVVSGQSKFDVSLTLTDTESNSITLTKSKYINVNAVNNKLTPAYIINELITNNRYGAGFTKNVNWLEANTDCISESYFLNIALTERRDLASIIEVIAAHGWVTTIFSGSDIRLLLAKDTTPTKSIELDDMIGKSGEQVIDVSESGRTERFNRLSVEYTDPEKEYSVRPVLVEDLADQQDRGIKKNTVSLLGFTDPDIAKSVGFKMMRNSLFGRRIVSFSLGPKFLDLETGDLCYINASTVGLSLMRTRILGIDETEEFNLTVNAREEPNYIYDPIDYSIPASKADPAVDTAVGLSNAIGFRMVEVPNELLSNSTSVELMPLYAKPHADTIGYDIYTSTDDSTYDLTFEGRQPLPYGIVTTSQMSKDSWLDTNEISIDTSTSIDSTFSTISRSNMMLGSNLTLIGNELMLHQTSTLGTTNIYTFDNFARNRHNTLSEVHNTGASLFQLNDAQRFEFLTSKIGVKYFFKAVPVNTYQQVGDISEVTAVGMTVEGWAFRPYRPGSIWLEENNISQRSREKTTNRDVKVGWDITAKNTGFGRTAYNTGTYGSYSQDIYFTGSDVEVYTRSTALGTTTVNFVASADVHMKGNNPTTNYDGTTIQMESNNVSGQISRTIIKFDISSLPANINITSAKLQLHVTGNLNPATADTTINRLTQLNFVDTTATWNTYDGSTSWDTAGGDFTSTNAVSHTFPAATADTEIEVKILVNDSIGAGETEAGFLMKYVDESTLFTSITNSSSEHATVADRPNLEISYSFSEESNKTLSRTALVGLTQSYTYTEAFNLADNTTFKDEITFRTYTKSIYGRSKDYNEKLIIVV